MATLSGCASKPATPTVFPQPAEDRGAAARRGLELAVRAQELQAQNKPAEALATYREAVQTSTDLPGAVWNNYGLLLVTEGNVLDGATALRVAAEKDATDPRPLENLGWAYHDRGHDEPAYEAFAQALARNPRSLPALRGAVRTARRLGRSDEQLLEYVESALLIENDPAWRAVFERERLALRNRLDLDGGRPVASPDLSR